VPDVAYLRYEDGTLAAVRVEEDASGQPGTSYDMQFNVREVLGSLQDIASDIGAKVSQIGDGLRQGVPNPPDEVTIELGFALEATSGLPVLARAGGEAHVTVTATWRSGGAKPAGD
jgi:hypothetical protein